MKTTERNYVVRQSDAAGEPIIVKGTTSFFADDQELVPEGFDIDCVQNRPELKTIYVKSID